MAMLDKEKAFVEIASKYLDFTNAEKKHMINLVNRGCVLSPQLWEMIVEKVSGLEFVDQSGYDYSDLSEAKTGSCTVRFQATTGYDQVAGQITNIGDKQGVIRTALYNDWTKKIDFFLIPTNHSCTTYTTKKCPQASLKFSYNRYRDEYSNGLERYRKKNLEEVCQK